MSIASVLDALKSFRIYLLDSPVVNCTLEEGWKLGQFLRKAILIIIFVIWKIRISLLLHNMRKDVNAMLIFENLKINFCKEETWSNTNKFQTNVEPSRGFLSHPQTSQIRSSLGAQHSLPCGAILESSDNFLLYIGIENNY